MENNIIFVGPPGSGKTFQAKKAAVEIVWNHQKNNLLSQRFNEKIRYYNPINFCDNTFNYVSNTYLSNKRKSLIRVISMHEGMTSSDLIYGTQIRTKSGLIEIYEVEKVVLELVSIVKNENNIGVLILDDINRVNCSNVLGELLYAFTHRNEEITLSNGKRISIPDNLYVFITMNELFSENNLDNNLFKEFYIYYLRNSLLFLENVIHEWVYKKSYFSYITDAELEQIDNDITIIKKEKDDFLKDGNEFIDEIKNVIKLNFFTYLENDKLLQLEFLDYCAIDDIKINFVTKKSVKKRRKYKLIIDASIDLLKLLKRYVLNIERELLSISKKEWERYNGYIIQNLNSEYYSKRELFQLGISYFIPHDTVNLNDAKKLVLYQMMSQVIPLIKQYILEGILIDEKMPSYNETFTMYQLLDGYSNDIEINELVEYSKMFDNNIMTGKIDSLKNPFNKSHHYNPNYSMMFSLIKVLINSHIISNWQLMDLLIYDTNIINKKSNDNIHDFFGGLLAEETIASTILAGDKAKGNENLKAYTLQLHSFSYKGKKYLLFNKYLQLNKNLQKSVEECRENGITTGRRSVYLMIKVLLYDFFNIYKSNIEGYLNCNQTEKRKELLEILKLINQTLYEIDEIRLHGLSVGERLQNLYIDITDLKLWQLMKNRELKGVYMTVDNRYQTIMDITGIHQIILQGPPGTSKTYGAKEFLASEIGILNEDGWDNDQLEQRRLISNKDKYELPLVEGNVYWDIIQFHPSYTYEDFVRGITVQTKDNGLTLKGKIISNDDIKYDIELDNNSSLYYQTVNKVLGKIAKIAFENKDKHFYLIIDEINRANLATVFGELIYALEYRDGKGVSTPYTVDSDENIIIPSNLYIIGTMNTADKSIASIDYAIRRRFLFFPILPNIEIVYKNVGKDLNAIELKLFYIIDEYFNQFYNKDDYNIEDIKIGHTFFLRQKENEKTDSATNSVADYQMKLRFIYQILPVMKEYLNDGILLNEKNSNAIDGNQAVEECLNSFGELLNNRNYNELEKSYDDLITVINRYEDDIKDAIKSKINE